MKMLSVTMVIVTIFFIVFTIAALSYVANDQSKRADLGITINHKGGELAYNFLDNNKFCSITFNIDGSITNEGSRSFQINSFDFYVAFINPESFRENTTIMNAETTGFKRSFVDSNGDLFNWTDKTLNVNERHTFAFSVTVTVDAKYLENEQPLSDCRIRIDYSDEIGSQIDDLTIYGDWAAARASFTLGSSGTIVYQGATANLSQLLETQSHIKL
jgi:hypothetical protein